MTETFDHPNRVRMRGMPAKIKGRPNEERKVKELLNKLQAQKAAKKPSDNDSSKRQSERDGARFRQAV